MNQHVVMYWSDIIEQSNKKIEKQRKCKACVTFLEKVVKKALRGYMRELDYAKRFA